MYILKSMLKNNTKMNTKNSLFCGHRCRWATMLPHPKGGKRKKKQPVLVPNTKLPYIRTFLEKVGTWFEN